MLNLSSKPFSMGLPFGGAVSGVPPFVYPSPSPIDYGNVIAAWDARYNVTVDPVETTRVTSWAPAIGNSSYVLAPTTTTERPYLQTRTDGRPEIGFQGAQRLVCDTIGSSISSSLYVCMALQYPRVLNSVALCLSNTSTLSERMRLATPTSGSIFPTLYYLWSSGGTGTGESMGLTTTATSRHVNFFGLWEPATTVYSYASWTTPATSVTRTSRQDTRVANRFEVAAKNGSFYSTMAVSAIWVYGAFTNTVSTYPQTQGVLIHNAMASHYPKIA